MFVKTAHKCRLQAFLTGCGSLMPGTQPGSRSCLSEMLQATPGLGATEAKANGWTIFSQDHEGGKQVSRTLPSEDSRPH